MQLTSIASIITLGFVCIQSVLAAPKVRATPIALIGCTQWPLWQGSGGDHVDLTGRFGIQIVQTSGKSIEGFYSISTDKNFANGTLNYGEVRFPSRSDVAITTYDCSPSSSPYLEEAYTPGAVLQIAGDVNNATILYAGPHTVLKGATPLLPYNVYDNSTLVGKQLDGIYLGGYSTNAVTWAVKMHVQTGAGLYNYYTIRLLGPKAKPLCSTEFTALLRAYPV